jgi:hypothetical protein
MPIDEMDNTSTVDVEDVNDGSQDNTGDQDTDFLVVNERTRFRTAEDAIKSFDEAGKRIQSLSGWEKEIKDRFGVSDPQTAAALLQELADRREAERTAAAAPKPKPAAATTQTDDEEGLSTEDAQALKWLKKHAPRLGFVPKEELTTLKDELQKQIEELRTGNSEASQQVFEAQRNALVDSGRESLKGWMATEKITDNADGEKQLVIESLIRDWVNSDPDRQRRFFASTSESRAVVKEGFDKAIRLLGWKTVGTSSSSNASSHAANKGAALARNSKRMPQNGPASRAQNNSGKPQTRVDAGGRKDFIGSAHNDAWEIANKHFHGTSAE